MRRLFILRSGISIRNSRTGTKACEIHHKESTMSDKGEANHYCAFYTYRSTLYGGIVSTAYVNIIYSYRSARKSKRYAEIFRSK